MNGPSQPVPPPPPGIPPPPGMPPQPGLPVAPKKGLSPLAWVGIGCAVVAVLGMLVMGGIVAVGGYFAKKGLDKLEKNPALAAAEAFVRLNPDLDVVSTDQKAGTITVKNNKTGEVMTLNAKDAAEGRFEVKTEDGKAVFDASGKDGTLKVTNEKGEVATFQAGTDAPKNLPSWLPVYPGGTVQGTFDSTAAQSRAVAFTVQTTDPAGKVLSFYESKLKEAGLKVDKLTVAANDQDSGGTLTGSGERRDVSILVSSSGSQTQAIITVQEKK